MRFLLVVSIVAVVFSLTAAGQQGFLSQQSVSSATDKEHVEEATESLMKYCRSIENSALESNVRSLERIPTLYSSIFGSAKQLTQEADDSRFEQMLPQLNSADAEKILIGTRKVGNMTEKQTVVLLNKILLEKSCSFDLGDIKKLIDLSSTKKSCDAGDLIYSHAKAMHFLNKKYPISVYVQNAAVKQAAYCKTNGANDLVGSLTGRLAEKSKEVLEQLVEFVDSAKFDMIPEQNEDNVCKNFEPTMEALMKFADKYGEESNNLVENQLVEACGNVRVEFSDRMAALVAMGLGGEEAKKWHLIEQVCNCFPGQKIDLPFINENHKIQHGFSTSILRFLGALQLSLDDAFDETKWQVPAARIETAIVNMVEEELKKNAKRKMLSDPVGVSFNTVLLKVNCRNLERLSAIVSLADSGFGFDKSSSGNQEMITAARLCLVMQNVDLNALKTKWTKSFTLSLPNYV